MDYGGSRECYPYLIVSTTLYSIIITNITNRIRIVITPENKDVHILIPDDYIGRRLEVLLYAMDEPLDLKPENENIMAEFKGILTSKEAEQLQEYVKKSREEWNRNI